MAKRKRLSPAAMTSGPDTELETKAFTGGGRPPIADVTRDAATQSALDEITHELQSARQEGRMVVEIPLSDIIVTHLVRDRVSFDVDDMHDLIDSLKARGQQTPIEVVSLEEGSYGLISGWRRMTALQLLFEETGDPSFELVKALVRLPASASKAYLAMVEENEIRSDLSFYERARIAVRAAEDGVFKSSSKAVNKLFASARPAKRSKIIAFTHLVDALDGRLAFPAAIPEKVGLRLVKALQNDKDFAGKLSAKLKKAAPQDATAERHVIDKALTNLEKGSDPAKKSAIDTVFAGVAWQAGKERVSLSGPGVTDALLADLRQWLASRSTS